MNKVVYVLIGIVVIALAGGAFLAGNSDEDSAASEAPATQQQTMTDASDVADSDESEVTLQASGSNGIQEYSPELLAVSETDNNLLFFHAAWCTVCNSVERNLEAGSIPDDLSIFKIDYDSSEGQELAKQFNIPIQYTMVQVDTSGNEITQWVNNFGDGVDEISSRLL